MKESVVIAGITWSKFAEDKDGNAYLLADECVCEREFVGGWEFRDRGCYN